MGYIPHKKRITGNIKLRKIMIKPVCIIPARGGSVGVPKKNIHSLGGIPLIAHTFAQIAR